MELSTYIRVLKRWWWLLTLATLVGGGASYWYSVQTPPLYRTTATIMVGQFTNSDNPQASDFTITQQLAQYYAQMATRQVVLQGTVDALGLETSWDALTGQVNAMAPAGSQMIFITALDGDPLRAKAIADEVAQQLILISPTPREQEMDRQRQFVDSQLSTLQSRIDEGEREIAELEEAMATEASALALQDLQAQLRSLQGRVNDWQSLYQNYLDYMRGSRTNFLALAQAAYVPSSPASPATRQNVMLAMAVALVLAAAAAFLLEYMDDRFSTPEEAARLAGLPAFASIPKLGKFSDPGDALVVLNDPHSIASEAFGVLRSSILLALAERSASTVLVTSSAPGDGKSLTAANLAASFARTGKRTLLIDGDLRNPSLHRIFGVSNEIGFATLLQDPALAVSGSFSAPAGFGHANGRTSVGDSTLEKAVEPVLLPTALPNLRLLPSGRASAHVGDLLNSRALDPRLASFRRVADVIVIDCPPVLPLADTGVLAGKGGIILMVLDMENSRRRGIRASMEHLARSKATVAGALINRAPKGSEYYYYGYYGARQNGAGQAGPLSSLRTLILAPLRRLAGRPASQRSSHADEKVTSDRTAGQ